ncbi:MAG: SPOR domain-containing protein [Acidobacteriota bacterium]
MTDEHTHGVHLSDKQMVFWLMTGTLIASVSFLCGVLVGRGVQAERRVGPDATVITAPQFIADEPVVPDSSAADQVSGGSAGRKPAGSGDTFSYPGRLSTAEPPAERLQTPAAAAPLTTSDPIPPPDTPAPPEPATGDNETGGLFTVQVAAVKKRAEADVIVKRLKTKGYDAFVFVPKGADTLGVFRVRVGSFKTRREADVLLHRLEREEQYKPWVTR